LSSAFILLILIISCKSSKTIEIPKTEFGYQEFNIETFKGLWLTLNTPTRKAFCYFSDNYTVRDSDGEIAPFRLIKDSIYIDYKDRSVKGPLINLTTNEVLIEWGTKKSRERITYFRQ
jgi:hypothetical protein